MGIKISYSNIGLPGEFSSMAFISSSQKSVMKNGGFHNGFHCFKMPSASLIESVDSSCTLKVPTT